MAILADHLEVPSSTDCFTAFMWPEWLLSSTPNTSLHRNNVEKLAENYGHTLKFQEIYQGINILIIKMQHSEESLKYLWQGCEKKLSL